MENQEKRAGRPRLAENKLLGMRFRDARDALNLTRQELSDQCGLSLGTLGAAERDGKISEDTANIVARYLKVIPEYLLGKTDCKTAIEYKRELDRERAEDEALETDYRAYVEQLRVLRTFFSELSIDYEDVRVNHGAEYDFGGSDSPFYGISGPHCLRHSAFPGKAFYFSDEELEQVIKNLEDAVTFAMYKKGGKDDAEKK